MMFGIGGLAARLGRGGIASAVAGAASRPPGIGGLAGAAGGSGNAAAMLSGRLRRAPMGGGQPMTTPVASEGLTAGPVVDRSQTGSGETTEPRTFMRINQPMNYRGQVSDLQRSTQRHTRRASRSLTR